MNCFKAYDIRGKVPDVLDERIAARIGYAYANVLQPKSVVVGRDIRLTSKAIAGAVMEGLQVGGVEVLDIGLCGTENVYFSTVNRRQDGGIMVTASHNPKDYNGMKPVGAGGQPVGQDTGLAQIRAMVEDPSWELGDTKLTGIKTVDDWPGYIDHLLSYVDINAIKPLRVLVNPGNGGAGLVIEKLVGALPCEFIKIDFEPDGNFPQGVPNPLLPENQDRTAVAVRQHGADIGIAWDGDYDRCFLFDERGNFVNGYYLVGMIAALLLSRSPKEKIVYEPRLVWNTQAVVKQAGGEAVVSRAGHVFIKEKMREVGAIYGGEVSGHHYFRDFNYCDSGMIPWLLVIEMLSRSDKSLSEVVMQYKASFPASDEINMPVADAGALMDKVENHFQGYPACAIDREDGLGMSFQDWRFNLRTSNTEPLLRLNVESRLDSAHLEQCLKELQTVLADG